MTISPFSSAFSTPSLTIDHGRFASTTVFSFLGKAITGKALLDAVGVGGSTWGDISARLGGDLTDTEMARKLKENQPERFARLMADMRDANPDIDEQSVLTLVGAALSSEFSKAALQGLLAAEQQGLLVRTKEKSAWGSPSRDVWTSIVSNR